MAARVYLNSVTKVSQLTFQILNILLDLKLQ